MGVDKIQDATKNNVFETLWLISVSEKMSGWFFVRIIYIQNLNSHLLCFPVSQVEYQCDGFLEKNRDTVHEEQINILKASKVNSEIPGGGINLKLTFQHHSWFLLSLLFLLPILNDSLKIELWRRSVHLGFIKIVQGIIGILQSARVLMGVEGS